MRCGVWLAAAALLLVAMWTDVAAAKKKKVKTTFKALKCSACKAVAEEMKEEVRGEWERRAGDTILVEKRKKKTKVPYVESELSVQEAIDRICSQKSKFKMYNVTSVDGRPEYVPLSPLQKHGPPYIPRYSGCLPLWPRVMVLSRYTKMSSTVPPAKAPPNRTAAVVWPISELTQYAATSPGGQGRVHLAARGHVPDAGCGARERHRQLFLQERREGESAEHLGKGPKRNLHQV